MSAADDLLGPSASAHAIAAAVRGGRLRARDVVEAALGRAERHGAPHGAFLHVAADGARAAADAVDARVAAGEDPGPLAGVPFAAKDALCTEGVPTTAGSRILEGWRPPYDATAVARLRAAGAVLVGKTNQDELSMGSSSEHGAFGPVRNPWDPSRTAGGSSGGSAAAVALGVVPLALGSDTGGSIRQPAAFTGTVGLKPTYGRVSRFGLVAFASSLDQVGPFTRDVRDAALALALVAGPDGRDATCSSEPLPALDAALEALPAGLRVGTLDAAEGVEPAVESGLARALEALDAAGARRVRVALPHAAHGVSTYYVVATAEASSNLARLDGVRFGPRDVPAGRPTLADVYGRTRARFGAEVKRRILLGTFVLAEGFRDAYHDKAQRVRTLVCRDYEAAFRDADVIVTPVAPTTAFPLGALLDDPLAMYLSDVFTLPASLAGLPAVSVPVGLSAEGLPLAVQVVAPLGREDRALAVAAELERRLGPTALPPAART